MALARLVADEKTKTSYKDIDIDQLISFIGINIDFFAAPFLNYKYLDAEGKQQELEVPIASPAPPQPELANPFLTEYQASLFSTMALNLNACPNQAPAKQAAENTNTQHIGRQFQQWIKSLTGPSRLWARRLCGQLTDALNEQDRNTWHTILCGIPNFDSTATLFYERDPRNKLRKLLLRNHELAWAISSFILNAASRTEPHIIDMWYEDCALTAMSTRQENRALFHQTLTKVLCLEHLHIHIDFFATLTSSDIDPVLLPLLNYLTNTQNGLKEFMRAIVGNPPEYKESDTIRNDDDELMEKILEDNKQLIEILEQTRSKTSLQKINMWYQARATKEQKDEHSLQQALTDQGERVILEQRELAKMKKTFQKFANANPAYADVMKNFIALIEQANTNCVNDSLAIEKLQKQFEKDIRSALKTTYDIDRKHETHLTGRLNFDFIQKIEALFENIRIANAHPDHRAALNLAHVN